MELERSEVVPAYPTQGRTIVWAELLFLGDIVRDFNARRSAGIFLLLVSCAIAAM